MPTASHRAPSKTIQESTPSAAKRVIFAGLFALIAMGLSFYVITFGVMYGALGSGKLHPAVSPGVTWSLREVGVPVSVGLGLAVFAFTLWRSRAGHR